jgi:hypothetical protein
MAHHAQSKAINDALNRSIPIAFRAGMLQVLAKRTLEALASHYPDSNGKELAESLGIKEPILTRWRAEGDLSLPMLVQVLLATDRDWTHVIYKTGELVLKQGESERINLAGLRKALEATWEVKRGGAAVPPLSDRAIAGLVLMWRWGPRSQPMGTDWVWDPDGCTEPPLPVDENGATEPDDPGAFSNWRRDAAAEIVRLIGEELNPPSSKRKRTAKPDQGVRDLLTAWTDTWGEIAVLTFVVVRRFCIEPEPH